jgi:hypothetical protein
MILAIFCRVPVALQRWLNFRGLVVHGQIISPLHFAHYCWHICTAPRPRYTVGIGDGLHESFSIALACLIWSSRYPVYLRCTISLSGGCSGLSRRGGSTNGGCSMLSTFSHRYWRLLILLQPGNASLVTCSDQIMTSCSLGQLSNTRLAAFGA